MQPALFVALDVFWIPRRSAELKVAVKAMTVTENLAYRWLHIVAIFTYHTPELRMNPFRRVKDGLWTCERPSFRSQKTAFCEALRNMLISNRLQARSERAVNKRREGRQQEARRPPTRGKKTADKGRGDRLERVRSIVFALFGLYSRLFKRFLVSLQLILNMFKTKRHDNARDKAKPHSKAAAKGA